MYDGTPNKFSLKCLAEVILFPDQSPAITAHQNVDRDAYVGFPSSQS